MTITKEVAIKIATDMKKHLKDDDGFATFSMTVGGITLNFQKMPETFNKKGVQTGPAKLGLVYNPVIDGKTARKGKYFWESNTFSATVDDMIKIRDVGILLLKLMEKVNPSNTARTSAQKVDHNY